jgi:hypothetical protein
VWSSTWLGSVSPQQALAVTAEESGPGVEIGIAVGVEFEARDTDLAAEGEPTALGSISKAVGPQEKRQMALIVPIGVAG